MIKNLDKNFLLRRSSESLKIEFKRKRQNTEKEE